MTAFGPWVPAERRKLGTRFTDALGVAAEIHADQRRKGNGPPYIAHLLGVTAIALEYGATEVEAIAALLHDAIEDAPKSLRAAGVRTLIAEHFGSTVLDVVEGCTDSDVTPKPPWRARKEAYVAHLATVGPSVLLVSAADKVHNVRAIAHDYRRVGEGVWSRFSSEAGKAGTIGYYRGMVSAFRARRHDGSEDFSRLVDDLDAEVTALEVLAGHVGRWPL